MFPHDEDSANDIVYEDRAYSKWEREEKNRILRIPNQKRKAEEWKKLFPPYTQDDSFLESDSGVW